MIFTFAKDFTLFLKIRSTVTVLAILIEKSKKTISYKSSLSREHKQDNGIGSFLFIEFYKNMASLDIHVGYQM